MKMYLLSKKIDILIAIF